MAFATSFLDLPPLSGAGGTVVLPGSKSISNRVLLLAALCGGRTVVHDLLDSDDTRVMLDALRALGCSVVHEGKSLVVDASWGSLRSPPAYEGTAREERIDAAVGSAGGGVDAAVGAGSARDVGAAGDVGIRRLAVSEANPSTRRLFLGNAGTAMRPLTAALALIGGHFELSGVARMHERPIGDLVDALRQLGCRIDYTGTEGYPPLRIQPATNLKLDAPISVRGDVSSQFLTALLMALPLVAKQDIVVDVVGELISKPYIEITLNLLQRFGVNVRREGWQRFTIPAGSEYQSPGEIHVEADASSASYFVALGAIAADREPVRIEGVGASSIQGDIRFVDAAIAMGAQVTSGPNWLEVTRGAWPLKAIDLDCNHMPDAAMTLAVMALYADGPCSLRNIASWRVKETDRIAAMAAELRKLGAGVEAGADFLTVAPPGGAGVRFAHRQPTETREPDEGVSRLAVSDSEPQLRQLNPDGNRRLAVSDSEPQLRQLNPDANRRLAVSDSEPQHPAWQAATIETYDDHRVAMCFSLAAFNPAKLPVRILDPQCVAKTFPDYFETLFSVTAAEPADIPVICIDGPTASGKGTLASEVARRLGYHYLDSGALYRIAGFAATQAGHELDTAHEAAIASMAASLPVKFANGHIYLGEQDVSDAIRTEHAGMNASKVSALPAVRTALVALQHSFRKLPGLVADGRDMGTVIFPDATLKVYLTASAAQRADRRYKQLISKGIETTISTLRADLEARDARDSNRAVAPLRPAEDALLLDNSGHTAPESVALVLTWWEEKQPFSNSSS